MNIVYLRALGTAVIALRTIAYAHRIANVLRGSHLAAP